MPKEQQHKEQSSQNTKLKHKKTCDKKYQEVYELITEAPITVNEIYKKLNKNISEINNILLMLELNGNIRKVEGGYTCILKEK